MKVVVEFTAGARANLVQLLAGRAPEQGDVARFAALFAEDMEEQFAKNEGPPPEAQLLPAPRDDEWWWHYAAGIWAGFMVTDRPGTWFRPATRTVRVFAFRVRPPAP
jgi:hypothetical protein